MTAVILVAFLLVCAASIIRADWELTWQVVWANVRLAYLEQSRRDILSWRGNEETQTDPTRGQTH